MLAHDKSRDWGSFNSSADMDNVPLFERERRQDTQLVQRLQTELLDAKRLLEAQSRRQNDLEFVNEDLERRLEQEARERIDLEASRAEDERKWQEKFEALAEETKSWKARCDEEAHRRSVVEERLRRSEKELYRMHQKKYDIEKAVRREENERRKNTPHIMRGIVNDTSHNRRPPTRRYTYGATTNPGNAKPETLRANRALASAMDFFGI